MNAEPPFRTIAIVGLGLIGGSLALATRERWPAIRVIGVDSDSVIAHVRGSGAIDRSAASLADVDETDLIVLAAPVQQNRRLLGEIRATTPVVVTDVGSTKAVMVEEGRRLSPPAVFVGGHPLGGGEHGGFAYARANLFEQRPWILTPDGQSSDAAVAALTTFVRGVGARPVMMAADAHDRVMSIVSHLPQLTASALMDVTGSASGAEGLRLAGRGLVDTTRLASSPANVWRDVCETNAGPIGDALDLLIARLTEIRRGLSDPKVVDELFESSARWRRLLLDEK